MHLCSVLQLVGLRATTESLHKLVLSCKTCNNQMDACMHLQLCFVIVKEHEVCAYVGESDAGHESLHHASSHLKQFPVLHHTVVRWINRNRNF